MPGRSAPVAGTAAARFGPSRRTPVVGAPGGAWCCTGRAWRLLVGRVPTARREGPSMSGVAGAWRVERASSSWDRLDSRRGNRLTGRVWVFPWQSSTFNHRALDGPRFFATEFNEHPPPTDEFLSVLSASLQPPPPVWKPSNFSLLPILDQLFCDHYIWGPSRRRLWGRPSRGRGLVQS